MTAGCEFCQHPTCWQFDINSQWHDNSHNDIIENKFTYNKTRVPSKNKPAFRDQGFDILLLIEIFNKFD